jgi:hypothetical protein
MTTKVYDMLGIEVLVSTLEVAGVEDSDYPGYVDAYFSEGDSAEGYALNDAELDYITINYPNLVQEMAAESCRGH